MKTVKLMLINCLKSVLTVLNVCQPVTEYPAIQQASAYR